MTQIDPYDAPTHNATIDEPAALDPCGYYCYLPEGAPSNRASTRPGIGTTPTEAIRAATYWANQMPWVVVAARGDLDDETAEWIDDCEVYRAEQDAEAVATFGDWLSE